MSVTPKLSSAFILGYSGEVGKELTGLMLKHQICQKVVLIGRRKIDYDENSPQSKVVKAHSRFF